MALITDEKLAEFGALDTEEEKDAFNDFVEKMMGKKVDPMSGYVPLSDFEEAMGEESPNLGGDAKLGDVGTLDDIEEP